jgi:hypothetical protein
LFANSSSTSAWHGVPLAAFVLRQIFLKLEDRVGFLFIPSEKGVAGLAEESANVTLCVTMVDKQFVGFFAAYCAATSLLDAQRFDICERQPIFSLDVALVVDSRSGFRVLFSPRPESLISLRFVSCAIVTAVGTAALDALAVPSPSAQGLSGLAIKQTN